jgi:hypothetical protein
VDGASGFGDAAYGEGSGSGDRVVGLLVSALAAQRIDHLQLQRDPGQTVAQDVVDFPGDAAALEQRRFPGFGFRRAFGLRGSAFSVEQCVPAIPAGDADADWRAYRQR